jgi:hypothetical protein
MDRTCNMHERREKCTQNFCDGKSEGKEATPGIDWI